MAGSFANRRWSWVAGVAALLSSPALGTQVFNQAHNGSATLYKSAWYPPDGLDGDQYCWDNFSLASGAAITEVHWRGGYTNYLQGAGRAPVFDFDISIYRSISGGSQPDLGPGGRLVHYAVGGNAGEALAGTFGGVQMYDYAFTLPSPFQAAAGTNYWVEIVASQGLTPTYYWPPDWSLAQGTGGNNAHFTQITGGPIYAPAGDLAFSLWSADAPTVTIAASASPVAAGTISGAGAYPIGSTASLQATANAGWGFVNWTEGASQVSTNPHYTFTASVNRTLVAHFTSAYTITTSAWPTFGGTTSGDGVFNSGATVTVHAAAELGFVFADWMEGGAVVSTAADYTFPAQASRALVAEFALSPLSESFDFDNAPVHTSLPIDLVSGGLGAHLTATGQGFSIQPAYSMGFTPAGFAGLCIYPNSVYGSDLTVAFTEPLTAFSIMYSPQELGCDTSEVMRATGYLNGVYAGTATATVPAPGTWPTGTLRLSLAAGFDSVVVHYDSRPPTCQNWGPIFLADNMVVTRQCVAPAIVSNPLPQAACADGAAAFAVGDTGTPTRLYRWQRQAPGGYVDLLDGSTSAWDGGGAGVGAMISGATTPVLSISAASAAGRSLAPVHGTSYRCVVTNPCGSAASAGARLYVNSADFNGDGDVGTDLDIEAFFACLAGNCCATCGSADFNADGDVGTDLDIESFFRVLAGGPC